VFRAKNVISWIKTPLLFGLCIKASISPPKKQKAAGNPQLFIFLPYFSPG